MFKSDSLNIWLNSAMITLIPIIARWFIKAIRSIADTLVNRLERIETQLTVHNQKIKELEQRVVRKVDEVIEQGNA